MNRSITVDGNVLNIKTKFVVCSRKPRMILTEAIVVSKNGKEVLTIPAKHKGLLLNMLSRDMDIDYYLSLKSEDQTSI